MGTVSGLRLLGVLLVAAGCGFTGLNAIIANKHYDVRDKYGDCRDVINYMYDQDPCGTCSSIATTSAIADRKCMSDVDLKKPIDKDSRPSASQAAACSDRTRTNEQNCEDGLRTGNVYRLAAVEGLPSGGRYTAKPTDKDGCVPFALDPRPVVPRTEEQKKKLSIECRTDCFPTYTKKGAFKEEMEKGKIFSYWTSRKSDKEMENENVRNDQVETMQKEIMERGSITVIMSVWDDIYNWDGSTGIYEGKAKAVRQAELAKQKKRHDETHAVRIIGFDTTGAVEKWYWIVASSWGDNVGLRAGPDKGYFHIRLGTNVEGIESDVSAPIINAPESLECSTTTFRSKMPIDEAVWLNVLEYAADHKVEPIIYLFQGSCCQKVIVKGRKVTPDGPAALTAAVFRGAPLTPITQYIVLPTEIWMTTDDGIQVHCKPDPGAGGRRFTCDQKGGTLGPHVASVDLYVGEKRLQFQHIDSDKSLKDIYIFDENMDNFFQIDATGANLKFGTYFSLVTTMLDLDGKSCLVFGRHAVTHESAIGVLEYPPSALANPPKDTDMFRWIKEPRLATNADLNDVLDVFG